MKKHVIIIRIFLLSLLIHFCAAKAQVATPLNEAAKIQSKASIQAQSRLNTEELKELTRRDLNNVLQSLFHRYYGEVKRSGLKLISAQKVAGDLSAQRRRSGNCCDIRIASEKDAGLFVTTSDGDGLFAIEGYGLQSVSGIIHDEQYSETGRLSRQCKYEVNLSYNNSRSYNCAEFLSRKIDDKVVRDLIEMLPIAMKNYNR